MTALHWIEGRMFRTLWRYLKLRIHYNRRLWGINGVIRVVDDGFIVHRWNFRFYQSLDAFCRSMSASRQEALGADAEAFVAKQQRESQAALEQCPPSLKRTLMKGADLINSYREAKAPIECAVTAQLTDDEFLSLPNDHPPKRVSWDQVREIVAYKVDLFTVDDVRLGFISQDGTGVEVSESMLRWKDLETEMSRRFPMIDPTWYATIIQPAFAENWTQLWPVA